MEKPNCKCLPSQIYRSAEIKYGDKIMVEKIKTWKDNWNDIIRYILFQDECLKELMLVPSRVDIIGFIEKYFIENTSGDEILTDEKDRVIYYDEEGTKTGNKDVKNVNKAFDIYVKEDALHNADRDRLKNRYDLIAERLRYLLTKDTYVYGMRFKYEDAYNLWTKTPGYKRYHVVFSYKKTI